LQDLAWGAGVNLSSCFKCSEMVNLLVRAVITGDGDPSSLPRAMFSSWSISELKTVASETNIHLSQCHNRESMVEQILHVANNECQLLQDYLQTLSLLMHKFFSKLKCIARELHADISECLEPDEIITWLICQGTSLGIC
jgi:hypothetical protein